MIFVDRDAELKALNEEYEAKKPSFVAVLGRRRLGKTELLKRAIPSAFFDFNTIFIKFFLILMR